MSGGPGGYNMGPNFNPGSPYDQTWASVPVPGISSGMLASGMNFDYLPPQAPIMVPQPGPSPLQQYVQLGGNQRGGAFATGSPVRIVHMTSPESAPYNGLVGDIIAVNSVDNVDGTTDMLFDLRIPLDNRVKWFPDMCKDKEHGNVKPSSTAMTAAANNVKVLGPGTDLYRGNLGGSPPYLIFNKIPTEKLEPQGEGSESFGVRRAGPPGVEMLPIMTLPGVMGAPAGNVPEGARMMGSMDMSMNMGMRGGPPGGMGGMPPSQPFGMGPMDQSMNMGGPMGPMGQSMNMGKGGW